MQGWEVDEIQLWAVIYDVPVAAADAAKVIALLANSSTGLGVFGTLTGTASAGFKTTVTLDVSQFSATFAINSIPNATISVALGRRADNVDIISQIHFIQDALRNNLKVEVFMQAKATGVMVSVLDLFGIQVWPRTPIKVFEGVTVGCGYRREVQGVEFVISLTHWLHSLTLSSTISSLTHPQNPEVLAIPAIAPGFGALNAAGSSGLTALYSAANFIHTHVVRQDLWGGATGVSPGSATAVLGAISGINAASLLSVATRRGGLQQWLLHLTSLPDALSLNPTIQFDLSRDVDFVSNLSNRAAASALRRIEPQAGGDSCLAKLNLRTNDFGGLADIVASNISAEISRHSLQGLTGHTMWEVLLDLSARYMFAVIPMVDRALVVPFVKGLRTPHTTIFGSEIVAQRFAHDVPRILRAVAVYGGLPLYAGSNLITPNNPGINYSRFGVGGWYQGASDGQILFVQAPTWMGNMAASRRSLRTGPGGVGSAITPGHGEAPTEPTPSTVADINSSIMNAFAHTLYVNEVLAHRQAELSTRLRLDISPGSVVKIEGVGEQFLGNSDQLAREQYGTVLQVSINIDAENRNASTSYRISHLRTKEENRRDASSIDRHPLWADTWSGCSLV